MLKYKLTSRAGMTFAGTQWGEGVCHETSGAGELCTRGWLHYYHSPELALILNPVHANIDEPLLWECEAEGEHKDDRGLKGGCTKLTTLRKIDFRISPEAMTEIAIRFAWFVALDDSPNWIEWAEKWLAGAREQESSWSCLSPYHESHIISSRYEYPFGFWLHASNYWSMCAADALVGKDKAHTDRLQKSIDRCINYCASVCFVNAVRLLHECDIAATIAQALQRESHSP